MSFTIQNAKDALAGMQHGTQTTQLTNLNDLFWRAGRNVLSRLDPRETRRIQNISTPIHDDIYNYALPSDAKRIIDIRPQTNRDRDEKPRQRYGRYFDIEKGLIDNIATIQHDSARKFIRISQDISPAPKTIHAVNSLTANGTWALVSGTGGSNLAEDDQFYISGTTSLKFDIDSDGSAIEITDMSQVDLAEHEDISTLFLWVYMPDSSIISSVNLRWGSASTAYWDVTEDDQHDGTSFRDGWNLLGFAWNGASKTGSPDSSAVDYSRVTINATAADTDIRVDNIVSSLGEIWEIVYYSNLLFRSSGGTWKAKPSADSDLVNLDEDSYNIWLYEVQIEAARQSQGSNAAFDVAEAEKELFGGNGRVGLYRQYRANYPSEAMAQSGVYYRLR